MKNIFISMAFFSALLFSIFSFKAMAVSESQFTVETKNEKYEIRAYDATIVAETVIESGFDQAGNRAFRILADYIFGKNKSKAKIEMTAPVAQQSPAERPSEKIAMTATVIQTQIADQRGQLVQFTMPDKWTMDNLPEPDDSRVHLRKIPPRKVAVHSYSGSWSESRFRSELALFKTDLEKNNIKTIGEPIFARFDSPFRLWFLRRNEIWLEVSP